MVLMLVAKNSSKFQVCVCVHVRLLPIQKFFSNPCVYLNIVQYITVYVSTGISQNMLNCQTNPNPIQNKSNFQDFKMAPIITQCTIKLLKLHLNLIL